MSRFPRVAAVPALAVLALLAQACTSSGGSGASRSEHSVASADSPASAGPAFLRSCDSSVYGRLGHGWSENEITLGPVTFVGLQSLASAPASQLTSEGGKDARLKVIAVVRSGPDASVRVAPAGQVALLYDPASFRARRVSEGDSAVTFEPCKPGRSPIGGKAADRPTQFNGAFIVDGPGCVLVQVRVPGDPPVQRSVPIGAGQVCS